MNALKTIGQLKLQLLLCAFSVLSASAFYDPTLGRWINRDPIQEEGSRNLYLFVENAPLVNWDAFGLRACTASEIADCKLICHPIPIMGCSVWERRRKDGTICNHLICPCARAVP